MLAFLNTPTFPVFSPPTYFNPAFILRFYLAFIYCVLLFTNTIYHVMRTDTCNKPHTLRDAVTGRNRNRASACVHRRGWEFEAKLLRECRRPFTGCWRWRLCRWSVSCLVRSFLLWTLRLISGGAMPDST